MTAVSSNLIQPKEWQPVTSTTESHENTADTQPPTTSWQMVPYVEPIPIRTWPNLHSLFTVATLITNVACLIFPNPLSIGANIVIRCLSTAFAIYAMDKAKISTNLVNILAILLIKNWAIGAIPLDMIYEGINLNRCQVSREFLKSRFNSFFQKPKKPPFDVSRFLTYKYTKDPQILEDAREILNVPLEQINNQEFIDERYNGRNRKILIKRRDYFESTRSPFAAELQLQIDYRDTAYKTLTERNKKNSGKN